MVWRSLLRRTVAKQIPRPNSTPILFCSDIASSTSTFPSIHSYDHSYGFFTTSLSLKCPNSISSFSRHLHSNALTRINNLDDPKFSSKVDDEEADGTMNEFLSRFVWIMRKKLIEAYPTSDKQTVDGMLLVIVGKVVSELEKGGLQPVRNAAVSSSDDFSEDLWKTVWEVSNMVLEDMNKERKKEKMKGFLQSEEVKVMCRFAGEIGVRGTLLRELRFKWAREKMEEHEFYEGLERMMKEAKAEEKVKTEGEKVDDVGEKSKTVTLPKRRGKINYKIYGLNLSDPKWAEVADRIHETEELIWPPEPKLISGKAKLVTEKILRLNEADDPTSLITEWVEIHQPSRVDWVNLLDKLKQKNNPLYLKVAELALTEKSFETSILDYSNLIRNYAEYGKYDDVDRLLKKMNENGYLPDAIIASSLIHMYSKAGNLDRTKEAFESLRSYGVQPDEKIYNAMIMSYVNAGQPNLAENLLRELEAEKIKPSYEIYMALLQSYAHLGNYNGVNGAVRISQSMDFAGFERTLESSTLLVEAYARSDDADKARDSFDYMLRLGIRPDDRVTASMISAYERKNHLDKALDLLLKLEQDGFEPGVATYTVFVDWFAKMKLVDEAEQILGKISQLGEAPPLRIQVSLCDMYARVGNEKKALQALGVLEARKDQLRQDEFERIIKSLLSGGFAQNARKIQGMMEAQGFTPSQSLQQDLRGADRGRRPSWR